ncbi:MAG: hypothetical protein D4S01_11275 [Dehalococcoidia bacterium]|nr:MAG: hypothetical protein D4S01_11275 [Dehalococcoidia bacterium]
MSEQNDTILRELEEATTESEPTSEGDATESTSDDSKQPEKVIEQIIDRPKPQIDYAQQQVDAWAERIAKDTTGEELNKLKDNKSLQWLHSRVEQKLGIPTNNQPESKDFAKQMADYKAQEERNALMDHFKTLPVDQRKEITKKIKDVVDGLGADPVKALQKAMSEIKEINSPTPIIAGNRVSTSAGSITMEKLSKLPQREFEEMEVKINKGEVKLIK